MKLDRFDALRRAWEVILKYKILWVFGFIIVLAASVTFFTIHFSCRLLPQGRAGGTTYYSAKNGNDNNPGTKAAPFLTIQKAADIMVAGDTVIVGAGTYAEGKRGLNPANSGTAGNLITFKANGAVVINGMGSNPTVDFKDKNYIVFDGFEVAYGANNIELNNATGVDLKNSTFRDSEESSAVSARGSVSCIIRNCTVLRPANCGILLSAGAHDNVVEYNTVKDTVTNDGLSQGTTENPAGENNVFQYNDSSGNAEDGLDFYSGDHTIIRGNKLYDNREKGLNLHGGSNCLIENNLIYGNDWYGLYLGIQNGAGAYNKFQNNVFYDNGTIIRDHPEDDDPGLVINAPKNTFINNTFIAKNGSTRSLFQLFDGAGGTVFYNNIFYNGSQSIFGFPESKVINIKSDYNLFYTPYTRLAAKVGASYSNLAAWQAATGSDTHSVFADPLFNDFQNKDFRLRSGSPAINAGTNVGAPATDILGNARGVSVDIGAYEYQIPGPVVTFSRPADGAVVTGRVDISAGVSHDLSITKVEFYIDGELDSTDTAAPHEATWYTNFYTNGNHTIAAKAYDASGNIGTATITVNVSSQIISPLTNTSVLVKYKAGTTQAAIDAVVQRLNLVVKKASDLTYRVSVPGSVSAAHFISVLLNQPEIDYAEPDYTRSKSLEDDITKLTGPLSISNGEKTPSLEAASALEDILTSGLTTGAENLTSQSLSLTSVTNQEPLNAVSRDIGNVAVSGLYTVLALFAVPSQHS